MTPHQITGIFGKTQFWLAGLLFLFTVFMIPGLHGFKGDMTFWRMWAMHDGKYGLINAYSLNANTNYPPLYHYALWAFAKMAGNDAAIQHYIGYMRIVALAADYWALWLLCKWIDRKADYIVLLLWSLLNVAYSYNTLIWGQVDAIFTAFAFASFYYLHRAKPMLSAAMMVLALNTKLQAIVFVPLWGILMIAMVHREGKWKSLLYIIPITLALQAVIILPFAFGEPGLKAVALVVASANGFFNYISMNACNMWYWFIPGLTMEYPDNVISSLGITYKSIGLLSFYTASLITLLPALRHTILTLSGKTASPFSKEKTWLSAALLVLSFYFFNTEMHERYSHPAFIFIMAYALHRMRFGIYIIFSIAYFLSLERIAMWLELPNYETFIFDARVIAGLFAIVMIWLFTLLYRSGGASTQRHRLHSSRGG